MVVVGYLGLGFFQVVARLAGTSAIITTIQRRRRARKNFVAQVNRVSEGNGNKWSDIVLTHTHTDTHPHTQTQTLELRLRLRRSLGDWKAAGGRGQTNGKLKRAPRSIVIGSRCNNTYNIHTHAHIDAHKLICDIKIVK